MQCSECKTNSDTLETFLDISLDIHKCDSIKKALTKFKAIDVLEGSNRYKCEKCDRKTEAKKQMTILEFPRILTIQLKRFGLLGGKLGKHVAFDTTLDVNSISGSRVSLDCVQKRSCLHSK